MLSSASASARRLLSRAISVLMLVAAAGLGMPRTAAGEDLAALLARPLSPGAVALLAEHATQPAAQKRLIEAVRHEDPAVRAVAARVAFLTMSKGAASALITAVAKEEHVQTGAEQVRALMALLGAPGDTIVSNAVKRLGAPAALALAESLGRTRPEDLPRHLPTLMEGLRPHEVRELATVLATAGAQHAAQAGNILAAVLAAKNDELARAFFLSLQLSTRRLPPAVLLAGLTSQDESQRILTLRHVLFLSYEGSPLPQDVIAAAAPPAAPGATARGAAMAAADLTWEAFVRELIARQRGANATKADWAGLLALPAHKERVAALSDFAYVNLTDAEVKSIDTVNGNREADKTRSAARRDQQDKKEAGKAPAQTTRTLPVFAKGLLADLMAVHGCRPLQNPSFATEAVKARNRRSSRRR